MWPVHALLSDTADAPHNAGPLPHGGNLDAARARFPAAPTPWIDLSTGINPHAYPVGAIPDAVWRRLPAGSALDALESTAAVAYGLTVSGRVVAAPGTQALIQILPRLLPARHVAVLGFGYQEHPAAWRAAGAAVAIVESVAELARADVAVVINPNNPDGRIVGRDDLSRLARALAARGATLIVDEAFMDGCDPPHSLAGVLPERGAVILRSFGKFFGLAGLRLGFALTGAALAPAIRAALGPWAVSGPAIAVATGALADTTWRQAEVGRLEVDACRLDDLLTAAGFRVLGGTSLFRLVEHAEASHWVSRLGKAGIWVRSFPTRPAWLRFGLPGTAAEWRRLTEALAP